MPEQPYSKSFKDLSVNDKAVLNDIPSVHFGESHDKFALNDLCLELSQVFDHEAVREVEMKAIEQNFRSKWQLSDNFSLVQRRNREIDNLMLRYEELAFRAAGEFNEKESQAIRDIFEIGRGHDYYDRQFTGMDRASFKDFLNQVQPYDNRIEHMEMWLKRKEQEVNARVNLPGPEL